MGISSIYWGVFFKMDSISINRQIIDVQSWAKKTLTSLGYEIQDEPQIIRGVPWSCVHCFSTSKGRVFLKHMDAEFALEPVVLKYLHDNVTQNVTSVIASNEQLLCFLMKDSGEPLRPILKTGFRQELFSRALMLCADIQIACIPHVKKLIALGVNDWRLDKIPDLYHEFLNQKEMLKADGLTESEIKTLHHLIPTMRSLCQALKAYNIPESIEHCDFHDNNVLIKGDTLTINDWGDACISHPFFSCVSALESAKRNHNLQEDDLYANILSTYLDQWQSYGSKNELLEALALARKIRYFMFALNFSRVKSCPGIEKYPEFRGYIAGALRDFINADHIIPIDSSRPELPDLIAKNTPKNILIVGCSGSGKSTLAKELSLLLGLRILYLDHFYWAPGWVLRDIKEVHALIAKNIEEDGWICDGNNSSSFALRLPKAEMLIWLDLPRSTCIWRVLKRITKYRGKQREDLPPGCVDRFNWAFLKWVWNFNKNSRPKLEKLYQETEGQLERAHLTSPQEVEKFIHLMKEQIHGQ